MANYWKRLFREMKTPLIPFEHYEEWGDLSHMEEAPRMIKVKQLICRLDPLRRVTLKFCVEFFRELVTYEEDNKMTYYNVAVTVGPNIFRSKKNMTTDIFNHAPYYDALIKLIEH